MREHNLKTVQPFFNEVLNGSKTFEVRKNDRGGFAVGDSLILEEYVPMGEGYTGQAIIREVTYVLDSPEYCKPGYVVLGINNPTDAQRLALTASIPLDRLEAICAAEKDGRCVVLPCKVGVDVYAVINKKVHDCVCVGWKWNGGNIYMLCMDRATGKEFSFFDFHFTGALSGLQTVFLSRAEAEAAKGVG
jgi:hypothetical protein